jgi:NAD(P)H-quinone oxidoreductase subunit 5
MQSTSSFLTPLLVLSAPLLLLVAGLAPLAWANAHPRLMARLNGTAAWLALASAILAAAVHSLEAPRAWVLYSVELPSDFGTFSIGTYVNNLTVIMLVLVSFVGAVVSRYARNYLDGESEQGRFHKWLSLTLGCILTLIVSGNLLMFSMIWIATSLCLDQLLTFYWDRPAAILAAHKKYVASRIGELSLLMATGLIGSTLHTLEFVDIFRIMSHMESTLPPALQWASMLIALSAALKSAQFPLHGWLIQVMEAPTPVSALLHAGIVNGGAFLIIRMSPIMSHSEVALGLLAIIGLVTLALASLVMLTQTSIKVSLAWSTTAQMGFMLLECGLGLYSLAMLHLVAHSLYKAHAFLASGSGVDSFRSPVIAYVTPNFPWLRRIVALAIAALMAIGAGAVFGVTLDQQPALIATGTIVAIAVSQLLLQASNFMGGAAFLLRSLGLSAVVCTTYFALHAGFVLVLQDSVLPARNMTGTFQSVMAVVIVAVFLTLLLVQQGFKKAHSPMSGAIYMHLYNGLYIDVFITRILQRVWPSPAHNSHVTRKSNGARS